MIQEIITKTIPLEQIVNDGKWSLHRDLPIQEIKDTLAASIARHGIITPPLVRRVGSASSFEVVSGYRRVAAAAQQRVTGISCRILTDSSDPMQLLERIVEEQIVSDSPLSPVMKARLFIMSGQLIKEKKQRKRFFGGLNIGSYKQLESSSALLELDPVLLSSIHHAELSEKTAYELIRLGLEEQRFIYQIIKDFSLNHNRQRTFFEMSKIILGPDLSGIKHFFKSELAEFFLLVEHRNLPQLTQKLFDRLFELSHPYLSRANDLFEKKVKELNVPEGIAITGSQSFEKDDVTVHIGFKDLSAAKDFIQNLQKLGII